MPVPGFLDVDVVSRGRPFAGARGQRQADTFETEGVSIHARKPLGSESDGKDPVPRDGRH